MKMAEGLQVESFASEPMVVQPVCIEFDDRGRLWVIQYLQYPNPAGLTRTRVDRWSRTTYDRVPPPPPKGPRGADRITILEDTDHDGRADQARDFVSGLNLATGLAFGHGGVFVLNVPYLLFYPDRDGNDVPDGDPEVCLTGFGMEDAHSVANSLTWGPDGWLYGCQGSTVTSRIRDIEFQQGVWRYHPGTRQFELFCEGGGNSWGIDFDDEGELIYSTNVGPYRNLHGVQGGYYWKSVGKHGALHNPYTFGYFDHIPHTNFTGGHVTAGGLIYNGTNLPPHFHQAYLNADLLGHGIQWHRMYPWGSTFTSSHGGYLLESPDTWFAPCDLALAPDGAIFVADWHDRRTAHPDPDADWDRSNGRIYRLARTTTRSDAIPDWRRLNTEQLAGALENPNPWWRRRALRILSERRDPASYSSLHALFSSTVHHRTSLLALWALHGAGGWRDEDARAALSHPAPSVRKWAIRLLGDRKSVSPSLEERLLERAQHEPSVRARGQLASTAARLRPEIALPILHTLIQRDLDVHDPFLPHLLWWGVEKHAVTSVKAVSELFAGRLSRPSRLASEFILERLMRRWMAEGTQACQDGATQLLENAPDPATHARLLAALDQGFDDRPAQPPGFGTGGLFNSADEVSIEASTARAPSPISPKLERLLLQLWREQPDQSVRLKLAARLGHPPALERARSLLATPGLEPSRALQLIQLLGNFGLETDAPRLHPFLFRSPENVALETLDALGRIASPSFVPQLIQAYPELSARTQSRLRTLLLSRKSWVPQALLAVEEGRLPAAHFSPESLRATALHHDESLDRRVRKIWGRVTRGTPEEKLAEMRRLNNDLNAGRGDPDRGRQHFTTRCATCHTLFAQGGSIGPDLTTANRQDRVFLLASLVDPSAAIRKEYLAQEIQLRGGSAYSGVLLEQGGMQWILGTATGERIVFPASEVQSVKESAISIMPEGTLSGLTPQDLRDLFAFLQSQPPAFSPP